MLFGVNKKRILIVTPHFYPEEFKVNDIAFNLQSRGFEVHVVSCIPNYPLGKFFHGYSFFRKRIENVNGVKVYRVAVIPRGNGSGMMLGLNYISYLISATFTCFFLSFRYKYEQIFVHQTSPVTVGIPAILVKKIQKIPLIFWVLDLWPESVLAASSFKSKTILKIIDGIVKIIYKNCDKILISSKGFETSILKKGNYKDKIYYFPNWAEDIFTNGLPFHDVQILAHGFRVMFAGNIGEAQNFEVVMNAALATKNYKNIHYCILGDGRKRAWVEDFIKLNSLEETVHLLGRYPVEMMPSFFQKADVMLMPLKKEPIFELTVPAKMQAYMASGKPIIGLIRGEGAILIEDSKCGISVDPDSFEDLANAIIRFSDMDLCELAKMGENGKRYYEFNFNKEKLLDSLFNLLSK